MTKSIPASVRTMVARRSGGVCERCGSRPASEMHHRRFRSRGGKDEASNLTHLCGGAGGLLGGNYAGCHGYAHSGRPASVEDGWAVSAWGRDPRDVPVRHHLYGWVTLTDHGTVLIHKWASEDGGPR